MHGKLEQHMKKASEKKQKCLLFIVYMGNGGLDLRCLNTYAVLLEKKTFALEHYIRQLALIESSYVVAYFQCPREGMEVSDGYGRRTDGSHADKNLCLIFSD